MSALSKLMQEVLPVLKRPALGVALLLGLTACGAEDFDPKSLLNSYRVVGVVAEPPTLSLAEESTLSVVDFHPNDMLEGEARPEVSYSWRLCPLTLGSAVRYECFIDELELEGSGPELTISPAALLAQLGDVMSQLEQTAEMLGPQGESVAQGALEVYVKLTATPAEGAPVELVKRLTLNLSPEAPTNSNPSFEGEGVTLSVAEGSLKVGEEIEVSAMISASATETYTPLVAEGEEAEEVTEELIIGWSVSAGELDGPYALSDDPTTTLTLPDEPQTVRLFTTLRDGRGGLAIHQLDLVVGE